MSERQISEAMEDLGRRARAASRAAARMSSDERARAIREAADAIRAHAPQILGANAQDVDRARSAGMKESLVDRLSLDSSRLEAMARGMEQVASLPCPLGETVSSAIRPNGLRIEERRVPLGVVGMIYEARPNVTADAFALCFKTGNAAILRGGSDAEASNAEITAAMRSALASRGADQDAVQYVRGGREAALEMMSMRGYIDVLIPRGGAGLIASVARESSIPVIETGTGNCHIYVDEHADVEMASRVIENAKTQRLGTCNTCESLVVHSAIFERALPAICARLAEHGVEMRGDERARAAQPGIAQASDDDWGTEYLDAIISIKVVDSFDEAIEHINRYSTSHSESIITNDHAHAMRFLDEIDSAAVYVNASTRFTDGGEFGLGAEIGISTQKLHARGPMGLKALTTTKFVIFGQGQTRG